MSSGLGSMPCDTFRPAGGFVFERGLYAAADRTGQSVGQLPRRGGGANVAAALPLVVGASIAGGLAAEGAAKPIIAYKAGAGGLGLAASAAAMASCGALLADLGKGTAPRVVMEFSSRPAFTKIAGCKKLPRRAT